jgi:hypothetical protein
MSDSELAAPEGCARPCPFCGADAIERHSAIMIGAVNAYEFRCSNYQCAVAQTGNNRADALEKWDRRHNQ